MSDHLEMLVWKAAGWYHVWDESTLRCWNCGMSKNQFRDTPEHERSICGSEDQSPKEDTMNRYVFHCPKCGHDGVERRESIVVDPQNGATVTLEEGFFACTRCSARVECGPFIGNLDRWMIQNPPPKSVEAKFTASYLGDCPHCGARTCRSSVGQTVCGHCTKEFTIVSE